MPEPIKNEKGDIVLSFSSLWLKIYGGLAVFSVSAVGFVIWLALERNNDKALLLGLMMSIAPVMMGFLYIFHKRTSPASISEHHLHLNVALIVPRMTVPFEDITKLKRDNKIIQIDIKQKSGEDKIIKISETMCESLSIEPFCKALTAKL